MTTENLNRYLYDPIPDETDPNLGLSVADVDINYSQDGQYNFQLLAVLLNLSVKSDSVVVPLTGNNGDRYIDPVTKEIIFFNKGFRIVLVPKTGQPAFVEDANKVKYFNGTGWTAGPIGSGDVVGPTTSTDNAIALFDGLTGELLKDGPLIGTGANQIVQLDGTGKLPAVDGSQLTNLPVSPETVTRTFYADINRVDSYTEIGSINKPFKTLSACLSAIESDIQTRIAGAETRSDCKYEINMVPGVYPEDISIPACSALQINMFGSIISGNITRIVTQTGFASYYSKLIFNGGNAHRAEKGHQSVISGNIVSSTSETTSYLYYMATFGVEIQGNITANNGTMVWGLDKTSLYDSGKTILGTGAILLEVSGQSRIKATISGNVSLYNCRNSEFSGTVNSTSTNGHRLHDMLFGDSVTLSAGTLQTDAISYSNIKSGIHDLTGCTVTLLDKASGQGNDSSVTGATTKDALDNIALANFDYYVNSDYTGSLKNGSIIFPYTSIQACLDAIGIPISTADARRKICVHIKAGQYDEDITVPKQRMITFLTYGTVVIGDGLKDNYYGSNTPRNLTIQNTATDEYPDSPSRPMFAVKGVSSDTSSTHVAYGSGNLLISGDLHFEHVDGNATSHETFITGTKIFGNITANVNEASSVHNLNMEKCIVVGTIVLPNSHNINIITNTEFGGDIAVGSFGRVIDCEIKGNLTLQSMNSYLPPNGFKGCIFKSGKTITIVSGNFIGDSISIKSLLTSGAILVSSGITYLDNEKCSGSEVDTGTDDFKYVTPKSLVDSVNVPNVEPGIDGNVLTAESGAWVSKASVSSSIPKHTPATSITPAMVASGELTLDHINTVLSAHCILFIEGLAPLIRGLDYQLQDDKIITVGYALENLLPLGKFYSVDYFVTSSDIPTVSSIETNNDGTSIIVEFDQEMDSLVGKEAEFTFTENGTPRTFSGIEVL